MPARNQGREKEVVGKEGAAVLGALSMQISKGKTAFRP